MKIIRYRCRKTLSQASPSIASIRRSRRNTGTGGQEGSNVTTGCGGEREREREEERERRKRCARREGSRHLLEARALVSGGCSCSASDSALVLLPAAAWRFNFRHEALTSPCHRTKNMARCTRANIHPSGVPLRPLFSAGTRPADVASRLRFL